MQEAQFYDYHLDIFACSKAGVAVSVELKLADWARALEQALVYQLCSDLAYVAIPHTKLSRVDVERLAEHGIGLISVEPHRCREVLKPRQSGVLKDYYRQSLMDAAHASR
jgi:hypothetical protein